MTRSPILKFALYSGLVLLGFITAAFAEEYEVKGAKIEVSLTPDQAELMLGEPVYLSFTVRNLSERNLQVIEGGDYRNALGRPESFKVTVTDEDGRGVPQPDAGPVMGGLIGPRLVPARGSHVFRLFLPHWATLERPGKYTVLAKRTLKFPDSNSQRWDSTKKSSDVDAQATTTVTVVVPDKEEIGKLIDDLGKKMLEGPFVDAAAVARTLSSISDERTVRYFAKAVETGDYDTKSEALRALGKYRSEEAFQALQV